MGWEHISPQRFALNNFFCYLEGIPRKRENKKDECLYAFAFETERNLHGERKIVTIGALEAYGADVKAGLARCMGREDFYLRLVGMTLADENFEKLDRALSSHNSREAFEAAHALKGATGNLGLTPLYSPLSKITERLRGATSPVDLGELEGAYREALVRLKALA